jgi:competence protein ComEC
MMRPVDQLGSGFAVALAGAIALGAWSSVATPWPIVILGVVLAVLWRNPAVVLVAAALLAGLLGARATAGLRASASGSFDGTVTLVTDPEPAFGAVRAEVRSDGSRFDVWARGRSAVQLRDRLAGERVELSGRIEPLGRSSWLRHRHVVARLAVDEIGGVNDGHPVVRVANVLRRTIDEAAEALPSSHRALFTGMVFGDDREQDPVVADDFRAAGLTHLLAVSGQNVAFVMILAAPLLSRLGLRGRLVASLVLLGFFALVTRFEPSVLRATAMAGLAAGASTLGRPVPAVRLLALAVGGLVLVDPFLVHSVGFVLSVAASAGILVLARPIADVLPGPRVLKSVVSVTVAAQVGVAPVLIPVFGGLPLASVLANVLVAPLAGVVMMWGLTVGVLAGLVGGPAATMLLLPARLSLDWIAGVARVVGGLPFGELNAELALAVGAAGVASWWARSRGRRVAARVAACLVVGLLLVPGLSLRRPPAVRSELAGVGVAWRVGGSSERAELVALDGGTQVGRALESFRRAGIRQIDVLALSRGGSRSGTTVQHLHRRVRIDSVWAPVGHRVPGATTPRRGLVELPGGLIIDVTEIDPGLAVEPVL